MHGWLQATRRWLTDAGHAFERRFLNTDIPPTPSHTHRVGVSSRVQPQAVRVVADKRVGHHLLYERQHVGVGVVEVGQTCVCMCVMPSQCDSVCGSNGRAGWA